MAEQHAELIKSLAKEAHSKRLIYENLAEINPAELPQEEVPRYRADFETAVAEWRRACIFLNSARQSMVDASTLIALLTAKDLRHSA